MAKRNNKGSMKGFQVEAVSNLDGIRDWIIYKKADKTTAIKIQLLSFIKNKTLSYNLELRVTIENGLFTPLLALKFRSSSANELPLEASLREIEEGMVEDITSEKAEPIHSLIYKDYVSSFHFSINDEKLSAALLGIARLTIGYDHSFVDIPINRGASISLLLLKEKYTPQLLSDEQKSILLQERERHDKEERIKKEAAEKQVIERMLEDREKEAQRKKELEQIRQEEEQQAKKKEEFLMAISKELVSHLFHNNSTSVQNSHGITEREFIDGLLDISASKNIMREFNAINNICVLIDSADNRIRVSSEEVSAFLIKKEIAFIDVFKNYCLKPRLSTLDAINIIDGKESFYLLEKKWEDEEKAETEGLRQDAKIIIKLAYDQYKWYYRRYLEKLSFFYFPSNAAPQFKSLEYQRKIERLFYNRKILIQNASGDKYNEPLFDNCSLDQLYDIIDKTASAENVLNSIKQVRDKPGGCYIATAIYGSYDCPEVWTLRRFRDQTLSKSRFGRLFIKYYYAISPTLVRWFGRSKLFKMLWRKPLDRLVIRLHNSGFEDAPYQDMS